MPNSSDNQVRKRLVLASASPRRKELLSQAGYEFEVIPSEVEEPDEPGEHMSAIQFAESLALLKARVVAAELDGATVIGADTVVALNGQVYGKAETIEDARRILTDIMHNPHEVITAVALVDSDSRRQELFHAITTVTMNIMPEDVFESYLAGGLWRGKAGAYGIQDHGDDFVRKLDGSFSNVVGMPMEMMQEALSKWGWEPI